MTTNTDRVMEVEKMVDRASLLDVMAALELMCCEKAAHVRENWQDKSLASQWDLCARAIYKASLTVAKTKL